MPTQAGKACGLQSISRLFVLDLLVLQNANTLNLWAKFGGPSLICSRIIVQTNLSTHIHRETQTHTERHKHTQRDTHTHTRDTNTHRETHIHTQRDTHTHTRDTNTHRDTQTHTERHIHTQRETQTHTERHTYTHSTDHTTQTTSKMVKSIWKKKLLKWSSSYWQCTGSQNPAGAAMFPVPRFLHVDVQMSLDHLHAGRHCLDMYTPKLWHQLVLHDNNKYVRLMSRKCVTWHTLSHIKYHNLIASTGLTHK